MRSTLYELQNGWTKEEMIRAVYEGNKNKKADNEDGDCVYRTEDNNKCFVGVFIPDDLYHSCIDGVGLGLNAKELLTKYPGLLEFMPLTIVGMLVFQTQHDIESKFHQDFHGMALAWINQNVA